MNNKEESKVQVIKNDQIISLTYLNTLDDNDEIDVSYYRLDEFLSYSGVKKFTNIDVASIKEDIIDLSRTYFHVVA